MTLGLFSLAFADVCCSCEKLRFKDEMKDKDVVLLSPNALQNHHTRSSNRNAQPTLITNPFPNGNARPRNHLRPLLPTRFFKLTKVPAPPTVRFSE